MEPRTLPLRSFPRRPQGWVLRAVHRLVPMSPRPVASSLPFVRSAPAVGLTELLAGLPSIFVGHDLAVHLATRSREKLIDRRTHPGGSQPVSPQGWRGKGWLPPQGATLAGLLRWTTRQGTSDLSLGLSSNGGGVESVSNGDFLTPECGSGYPLGKVQSLCRGGDGSVPLAGMVRPQQSSKRLLVLRPGRGPRLGAQPVQPLALVGIPARWLHRARAG